MPNNHYMFFDFQKLPLYFKNCCNLAMMRVLETVLNFSRSVMIYFNLATVFSIIQIVVFAIIGLNVLKKQNL
jgi:hypothetical protein